MSSGFVTESEIAEARKKRQEEWEKVRQPDQPLERPEEPYDSRSLFERLKEQRDKKDLEYEEAHKFKNMIRGLDDDEINFLDIIDKAKFEAEKQQQIQEDNEMSEFRQRVASLQEQSIEQKIIKEVIAPKPKVTNAPTRPTQKSILAGVIRKRVATDNMEQQSKEELPSKMCKMDNESNSTAEMNQIQFNGKSDDAEQTTSNNVDLSVYNKGALKCVAVLPGIGKYKDSSDSEKSTDTDDDYDFSNFDWIGRKVKRNHDDCDD